MSASSSKRTPRPSVLALWSLVPYALNSLLVGLWYALGLIEARHWVHYVLMIGAVYLVFVAVSCVLPRGGRSASYQTIAQMLAAMLPGLYVNSFVLDPSARMAFVLLIVSPLAWGVLLLSSAQFLLVAVGYFAGYGGLLFWLAQHHPQRVDLQGETLVALALLGAGAKLAYLGGYVFRLRVRLKERSLALASSLQRLRELAHQDELTGLPNRHHLREVLMRESHRTSRGGPPLSIGLLDIDHFKPINDTHGHHAGDEVLRRVADVLRRCMMPPALAGRYGGEEFLLVLPGLPATEAHDLALRVCAAIAHVPMDDIAPGWRVTASIGVACHAGSAHGVLDMDALLAAADAALYRAKHAGRNRVESALSHAGTP